MGRGGLFKDALIAYGESYASATAASKPAARSDPAAHAARLARFQAPHDLEHGVLRVLDGAVIDRAHSR
jgi:hypothetical protein